MSPRIVHSDHYAVSCIEGENHAERFVIMFANLGEGQVKGMTRMLAEDELRSKLEEMGLTHKADELIQRAREHRDSELSSSVRP